MCSHCRVLSRLQNGVSRLRRNMRQPKGAKETKGKKAIMRRLTEGNTVCCVWEKNLKPSEVKMVRVKEVIGPGVSGGLAEVTLENGIKFRATGAKTVHLYQDKERLPWALEAPTRANVLIFTHGSEAKKHLVGKGCATMCEGIDFEGTEKISTFDNQNKKEK